MSKINNEWHDWQVITYLVSVIDMNNILKPGQAAALLARVYDAYDNDTPLVNDGSNVESVYYTCEQKTKGLYTPEYAPVEGHNNVSAGTDCVLSALETDDAWDVDQIGYNFALTPDIRTYPLFPTAGSYRIRVKINFESGNPVEFYRDIIVEA